MSDLSPISLSRFMRALDSLPPLARTIYLLHTVGGLSQLEVKERLKVDERAIQEGMRDALYGLHTMLYDQ